MSLVDALAAGAVGFVLGVIVASSSRRREPRRLPLPRPGRRFPN